MSTLDEILDKQRGRSRLNPDGNPNAPVNGGEKSLNEVTIRQPLVAEGPKRLSHVEMYEKFNKPKLPTSEELAKEQKKNRQRAVIAAVGDGLTALANMYFVNRGAPNMYTGKNTLSERARARRDALMKEREEQREAYEKGYMNALQLDEAWNRYKEERDYKRGRDAKADERYDNERDYKRERDAEADRRWQANFDEDKRRSDRSHNFQVRQHKDNVSVRREQEAKRAGKQEDIDSIYLEAIATDPDLRAEVERDILDSNGISTGQKTSYLDAKADVRSLIARKYLRNQAAGKYKVSAAGERAGGLLGTQGGFKDLGAKDVKGNKKSASWVNKGKNKNSEW